MIFQLPGERGYHIYYQILSGKKPELQGAGRRERVGLEHTGPGGGGAACSFSGPHQTRPWGVCSLTILWSVTSHLFSEPLLFPPLPS